MERVSGARALKKPTSIIMRRVSSKIALPNMIEDYRLPFKIMAGVATAGHFASLVKAGYKIQGPDANRFNAYIADKSKTDIKVGISSILDARALAEGLNRQNPGRKFRIPTEQELSEAERFFSRDYWVWAENNINNSGIIVRPIRRGGCDFDFFLSDNQEHHKGGVLLIEDR